VDLDQEVGVVPTRKLELGAAAALSDQWAVLAMELVAQMERLEGGSPDSLMEEAAEDTFW
jgi:hypothetical protein